MLICLQTCRCYCLMYRLTLLMQRLGCHITKLLLATILSCSKILGLTIHSTWKFVRTAVLGSQPATLSVALDSWCSEALYKTMLVWLLHHQSIIPCFIIFVTNHGVKSSPYDLVAKWQIVFIFWINLKSWYLVYCNPQKSPLESEIAPQIW